ncbi:MAG: TIGR04376 family protein [Geitlerinemataceae cyanobacterium]
MSLFGDFSKFLEDRLDEFLQNNPHLELQVLEDELRDQENDTAKLIGEFELKEKQLEAKILQTAETIQSWHARAAKARQAGRADLANAAAEREAALLREGNQLWAQRKAASDKIEQTQKLRDEIRERRKALKVKAAEIAEQQRAQPKTPGEQAFDEVASRFSDSGNNWNASDTSRDKASDPLEQAFQSWETDEELEQLKRNMKR